MVSHIDPTDSNNLIIFKSKYFISLLICLHLLAGADVNMQCADGTTALMAAILDRHLHLVHLLLSNGACVNMARKDGVTALMTSAVCGDERITEALLSKGVAKVDTQNRAKQTALILAAKHNHVAVTEVI